MSSHHPSANDFWKKLILQFIGLIAAFVLVLWGGASAYQWWKTGAVLKEARGIYAQGDFRGAVSAAKRAMIEDPSLVEAAQIAAESLDRLNSPEAVAAWSRVYQIRKQPEDALRWARSAHAWKQNTIAAAALQSVPETHRANGAYHALLGDILDAQEHPAEAEAAYKKAVDFAPKEPAFILRHASIIGAHSDDTAKLAAAESQLRSLTKSKEHSAAARRALATLKFRQKDWAGALEANRPLAQSGTPLLEDRIQQLAILQQLGGPEFATTLAAAQKDSLEVKDAAALYDWMNRNGLAKEALQWSATMEPRLARNPGLARRVAESHIRLRDWRALHIHCGNLDSWGDLEFLRNAYAAYALHQSGDILSSKHRWTSAISNATSSHEATDELLKLANAWGWIDESINILWNAANRMEAAWALGKLGEIYASTRSTEGLLRVNTRKTELAPNDDESRNRMIRFSLLLDRNIDNNLLQARALAKRHSAEPLYAATLALAELKGGRAADALAAFAKVPADKLAAPEAALYHGLALIATGQEAKAAEAIALAKTQPLLPEESLLLTQSSRTEK